MAIPIPDDVRELLQAPGYVHLSTLRADGSPCTWVVCAGLADDHILVCNPVPGLSGPVNPHRRRPAHTFDGTTHHDFPRLLDDIA
jgi:hypothetical protein